MMDWAGFTFSLEWQVTKLVELHSAYCFHREQSYPKIIESVHKIIDAGIANLQQNTDYSSKVFN